MNSIRIGAILIISFVLIAGLSIPLTVSPSSFFEFPYIKGLGQTIRILFYHVPLAWNSVVGFLMALFFSVRFLQTKQFTFDIRLQASAELGYLFCFLATVTGSFWAKIAWGSFWNWDPRETSIVALLLIYGAFFLLRSSIDNLEQRGKVSAIYAIIAGISAPFFIFVLPRITRSLHPGSVGDEAGAIPIVQLQMTGSMRIVFFASLIGFMLFFLWIWKQRVRILHLEHSLQQRSKQ